MGRLSEWCECEGKVLEYKQSHCDWILLERALYLCAFGNGKASRKNDNSHVGQ